RFVLRRSHHSPREKQDWAHHIKNSPKSCSVSEHHHFSPRKSPLFHRLILVTWLNGQAWLRGSNVGSHARPEVFPCNVEIGVLRITGDIRPCSQKTFAIDVNPLSSRRMLCFPEDVSTVIDAIEVNRLAVITCPGSMRRRCEPRHCSQCRPAANVDQQSMCDFI